MGRWNYRLVHIRGNKDLLTEDSYSIHEAYYYDGEDAPHSITEGPVEVVGETVEEARLCWAQMVEAFEKPILEHEDF